MSKSQAKLLSALGNFVNATRGINILQGEVVEINQISWTCDVKLPNTLVIYDVLLKTLKETPKGCVIVPKVGSTVNMLNVGDPFWLVISVEEVDKVIMMPETELNIDAAGSTLLLNKDGLKVKGGTLDVDGGGSTVKVDKNGIAFNGGKNGGLINISDLVSRLNTVEDDLNTLKQGVASWVILAQDGGAALRTVLAGAATGVIPGSWAAKAISKTKRSDIEDKKVTH